MFFKLTQKQMQNQLSLKKRQRNIFLTKQNKRKLKTNKQTKQNKTMCKNKKQTEKQTKFDCN